MKTGRLFFVILFFSINLRGQNLVPNPDFEDTIFCPSGLAQINACQSWENFGNTPDYFNGCASNGLNVPNSVFGFQYAHSGKAYGGIIPYRIPTSPDGPNYREILGVRLLSDLNIGEKYYFSFYVNYSFYHPNQAMACNKVGAKFSTIQYSACCPPPINNIALVYADSILLDTISWVRLSGSFIADSSYQYLMIGNFFDDQNTDTICFSPFPDSPYYYVDDVCVSTDSVYNESWTDVSYLENTQFKFYPIPSTGLINFEFNEPVYELKLFDIYGRLIYYSKEINEIQRIDLCELPSASYIISIKTKDRHYNKIIQISKN